jgi:type I restriction enzyme S subunit
MSQSLIDKFDHGVICASFCKSIRVKEDYISAVYIYLLLNRLYVTGEIMLFQVQSTGISNYKFEDFIERQKILIPKMEVQVAFDKIVKPMLDEIQILGSKNQLLQQTRDLLLPRLISGKLSIEHLLAEEENLAIAAEPEYAYGKD